jgi:hypothetical protein
LFTLFIHTATRHVFDGACSFQYNLLLLTFLEYFLWNNGLGTTSGFATVLLSIDEPIELLVDPRELVAKNDLEKQVENNIKCEKFLGEMCLEKETDISHSKELFAQDERLEEQIEPLESLGGKICGGATRKELVRS